MTSARVARRLRQLGFRDVRILKGGLGSWASAGFPLEAKASPAALRSGAVTARSSRRKVEVDVVHDLTALGSRVHAVAVALLGEAFHLSQPSRSDKAVADDVGVGVNERCDRRDVAFAHDQDMNGRIRIDILERQNVVVLVFDVGVGLTRNDAAEYAVGHGSPSEGAAI